MLYTCSHHGHMSCSKTLNASMSHFHYVALEDGVIPAIGLAWSYLGRVMMLWLSLNGG